MIQIQDKEGIVTSVLCFLLLLCYHASRDALITALPSLALCENATYDSVETKYGLQPRPGTSQTHSWLPTSNESSTLRESPAFKNGAVDGVGRNRGDTHFENSSAVPADSTAVESEGNYFSKKSLVNPQVLYDIISYEKSLDKGERRIRSANGVPQVPLDSEDVGDFGVPADVRNHHDVSSTGPHIIRIAVRKKVLTETRNNWLYSDGDRMLGEKTYYNEGSDKDSCDSSNFGGWSYSTSWKLAIQGSILCALHFMTVPGLLLGHYCTEMSSVGEGVVCSVFTVQWAVLALLTHVIANLGPVVMVGLRAWQGLAQGACYPCVYRLLEGRAVQRRLALTLIFSGSWWGSAAGTSLGALRPWAVPFYVAGFLALTVALVMPFIARGPHKAKVSCYWLQVARRDVVVSAMMHGGGAWVLHTLLLAHTVVLDPADRWWVLLAMVVAGGLTTQILDAVVDFFVPSKTTAARNHLLTTTILGLAMTTASLVTVACARVERFTTNLTIVMLLASIVGAVFGVGVTSMGYRQVLEVADRHRRSRALVLVNAAGAVGAGLASMLMLTMSDTNVDAGGFAVACVLPLSLVVAAAICVFFFLIFPTTQQDASVQDRLEPSVFVVPVANGFGAPGTDGVSVRSADNKSFRSAMSAATFKTAASRHRSRATSYNTVMEDVEADMYSLADDEASNDCKSVVEENEDTYSVHSAATSYRSNPPHATAPAAAASGQPTFSDLLQNGDRTSAWLHLHHQMDMTRVPAAGAAGAAVTVQPLPGLLF